MPLPSPASSSLRPPFFSFVTGVRNQSVALVTVFALLTSALMGIAVVESKRLLALTAQVNLAGQLRMLSQSSAFLVPLVVRGDAAAHIGLSDNLSSFDRILGEFQQLNTPLTEGDFPTPLDQLREQWTPLRELIGTLAQRDRELSDIEELKLHMLSSRTLQAAEYNVQKLLSQVSHLDAVMVVLVPVTMLLGGLLVFCLVALVKRRVLRPLQRVEATLNQLASGDLSARCHPHYHDELGHLMESTNRMAQTLDAQVVSQQQTLEQLQDSEMRHRTLWEMSSDAIVTIDHTDTIVFANPAVGPMFGYQMSELIGQSISVLQPERLRERHRQGMKRYMAQGVRNINWSALETQALHKDGHEVQVELAFNDMRLTDNRYFVGTFRDVTERKRQQQALLQSMRYDKLTGLPNRVLLYDHIELAIANVKRDGGTFGLLFLDLDNFKIINDTLGHEAGDHLLCDAAARLKTCVTEGDTVARVGGDEFVLLLNALAQLEDIDIVAQRALAAMTKSFSLPGGEGYVGVSIGASVYPDDASSRGDLLQHADIAMYRAKDAGRNNYQRYAESMQARIKWRMSMEVQLRQAIEAGELVLHYQPQINLVTGRVVGVEALVRWESPHLGRISPVQFIPLAEETGLIVPIGHWIVKQACHDAASWIHTPEGKECVVAINLSPRQFNERDLFDSIAATIVEAGIAPHHVELEITEGLVMQNPDHASEVLTQLRALGCTVALDDFGTGYSSLAYLRTFPLDCLKIDKSLINDVAIVRAVIQLARSFGFKTLAEGVEDKDVLEVLRGLGCDIVQGYYYARPMPLEDFQAYLKQQGQ